MKKSKLLQSSKEMLSRSFNPTKCKTSLRLSASRLKLLKNKKELQIKQMRKEIAQLLESGEEQKARMRVEHVIREEKMIAAYDLLEIYCELIIARLPVIESQKNCPIDLKEAIASVIFASLRCGDIPELLDVRKQLTAKYGKDFATAAIELRPQCGVGRMLVEKLSAGAPDVQTKTKILSAIAEEHNVKWEHEEEKDSIPSSDLPGGASAFWGDSYPQVPQPHFESADSQARPNTNSMHSAPSNVLQHEHRIQTEAETSTRPSVVGTTGQPEARPQGDNRAQLFQGESNSSSPGRQRWNMEFKDATSAAQAAAESAELASLAAKAAAELSMRNKIVRQDSTESHWSDAHVSKTEELETHSNPKFSQEHFPDDHVKKSSPAPNEPHNEQIDRITHNDHKTATRFKEDKHASPEEYNHSASLKSKSSSTDNPVNYGHPIVDQYQNPLKEESKDETSMKKHSFKNEAEAVNDWAGKTKNTLEKKIEKQQSVSSSRSHSSISDDVNIFANSEDPKYEDDVGEDLSVNIAEGGIHTGEASHQRSSHEEASIFYDKFDSDNDDHGFDLGPQYDVGYSEFDMPSLREKSPELLPVSTDRSPRFEAAETVGSTTTSLFFTREVSPPKFSKNLTSRDDAEVDNFAPVTYDDYYDGPISDIEDMNSGHDEVIDSRGDLSKFDEREELSTSQFEDLSQQPSLGPSLRQSGLHRKQLSISSDDELDHSRTKVKTYDGKRSAEPTLEPKDTHNELSNMDDESSSDGEEGLNFGKLTGGLRNKGNSLPFLKNRLDVSSSVKKETEKTTESTTTSTKPHHVKRPGRNAMLYEKKNAPDLHSESESGSSQDEEVLQRQSGRRQQTYTRKEVQTKSNLGASNTNFASDSSDEEDPRKVSLARKSHLQSGVSRRTRAPPSSSGRNSYSKIHRNSEANETDSGFDRKPIISNDSETGKKSEPQRRNSGKWENSDQHTSAKVASKPAKSIFWRPPEKHDPVKTSSISMQESKQEHTSEVSDLSTSLGGKSSNSYSPNTDQKIQSLSKESNQLDVSDQPTSPKMASKPISSTLVGNPEKTNSGKATSARMQKSKISPQSSIVEEPSRPPQKPEASISSEVPKSETSNKGSANNTDSPKRASHVHPKLPDYDMLFQSLRMNRS